MPQMMPINWMMLFFFFSLIYIIFIILNYYNLIYKSKNNLTKKSCKFKNISWKW